ncbi:MAG TPA: hypothetical protein VHJ18_24075 [Streptosporangiaceae bacterium]|jgi:hypothetical protein|nr:hypothetical protein [Streptosporangiaceae bacterium]
MPPWWGTSCRKRAGVAAAVAAKARPRARSGAYCLCRRTAFAVVVAATVPSAPLSQYRGSLVAGCLSKDSSATSRSRWNAVTPACGDRLNTTRLVPMPKLDRSIRNAQGSSGSSGWSGSARASAGTGVTGRSVSWPRRTKTSAPATSHFCASRSDPRNEYQPQTSLQISG